MLTHRISTPRTARLLQIGQLNSSTRLVWIAAHGYGMDIERFAEKFSGLPEQHAVLCPEGLSRFYWGGFTGRPAASWMTSTERLYEIEDFCNWLDQVYELTLKACPQAKLIAFGFSQGSATIMRWLHARQHPYFRIVLWSGAPPEDITYDPAQFPAGKLIAYWGDADQLVPKATAMQRFEEVALPFAINTFTGGHRIEQEPLLTLARRLLAEVESE